VLIKETCDPILLVWVLEMVFRYDSLVKQYN
jgi:hypothetical protein